MQLQQLKSIGWAFSKAKLGAKGCRNGTGGRSQWSDFLICGLCLKWSFSAKDFQWLGETRERASLGRRTRTRPVDTGRYRYDGMSHRKLTMGVDWPRDEAFDLVEDTKYIGAVAMKNVR